MARKGLNIASDFKERLTKEIPHGSLGILWDNNKVQNLFG